MSPIRSALLAAAALAATPLLAQEVIRHDAPGTGALVSRAVEIPPGAQVVLVGGTGPSEVPGEAGVTGGYGNTQVQTVSVLTALRATLEELGLSLGDVVALEVFLVGPDGGPIDVDGFVAGYAQVFGTDRQPHLPVQTVVGVTGLAHPEWLVTISATAVRPPG